MTILIICLLVSIAQIYIAKAFVAIAMAREGKGYDNHHPRMQQSKLTGWGARAYAAHQNGFEAFAMFACGVLLNLLLEVDLYFAEILTLSFVTLRFLYIYLYIADSSYARSTIWVIAFLCNLGLYILPFMY
ncbi:MAPEG family protein [Leptospira biflexa]|uniref:MAPEG family protein n=1 Tax=Leptospira biflexa TaxID=172 RepID=UPI001083EA45|nr:MAPEG family protein [Leptospira biflexa]TGM36722.1 MAPEG family protein [Leptospira biflexa]TGM39706.1 MAPEG family protein [Leptospira biflexa]